MNKQTDTNWIIYLAGPEGSAFQGGTFEVEFRLDGFPFKPPVVTFKTKMWHPNIDEKGLVCEDMIETGAKWAPTKRLATVMDKLKSMLVAPSNDNALNADCAKQFQSNQAQWYKQAQEYSKNFGNAK